MPSDQIEAKIFEDFTGGLYERGNDRSCPPNGLLECTDCYPLADGGLRAAFRWNDERADSRMTGGSTSRIALGMHVLDETARSLTDVPLLYLVAGDKGTTVAPVNSSAHVFANSTVSATAAFTTIASYSTVTKWFPTPIVPFLSTVGGISDDVYIGIAEMTSGGVYRIGSTVQQLAASMVYSLSVHQARLAAGITNNARSQVTFSEPRDSTSLGSVGAKFVRPFEEGQNFPAFVESFYPGDLVVGLTPAGLFGVQGDVAQPSVRELDRIHGPDGWTWGARTPNGVAYLTNEKGVWETAGTAARLLSPQMVGSPMCDLFTFTSGERGFLGQLACWNDWLFTPNGYVYDYRTGGWFKTTLPTPGKFPFWAAAKIPNKMYAFGDNGAGKPVLISAELAEETMDRASSFTFTLPLQEIPERTIELRQIVVYTNGYGSGGLSGGRISVTVTPTPHSGEQPPTAEVPAGVGLASFRVGSNDTFIRVRIRSEANDPSGEAPSVSRVILGLQPRSSLPGVN